VNLRTVVSSCFGHDADVIRVGLSIGEASLRTIKAAFLPKWRLSDTESPSAAFDAENFVEPDLWVIDTSRSLTFDEKQLFARARSECIQVVLYADMSAPAIRSFGRLLETVPHSKCLVAGPSEEMVLHNSITEAIACSVALRVVRRLSGNVAQLPPIVRRSLIDTFATLQREDPYSLARKCEITRRSLDRAFHKARFASGHILLSCPRLIAAYSQLHATEQPLSRIAQRCGYNSSRSLQRHSLMVTGVGADELRHRVHLDEFIECVRNQVIRL
jgi:AraC-like DNA-binding protein